MTQHTNDHESVQPIHCLEAKELMPWFVTGRLTPEQEDRFAAHLSECSHCQRELVEVLRLQNAVSSHIEKRPAATDEIWKKLRSRAFAADVTKIDVGTLLLGFQLGIRASNKHSSLNGSLRVLGKTYRVLGHSGTRGPTRKDRSDLGASIARDVELEAEKEGSDV